MNNPVVELSLKISRFLDHLRDKHICGMSLARFMPSRYSESHGATGSQSAPYRGLEEIFRNINKGCKASLIDIGCGKGRVLAYLMSTGADLTLTGVEIDPKVADIAREWSSGYPQIRIITGNAFELDYNDYDMLFMYRPMEADAFKEFINMLEKDLRHKVMLYYYADSESGYYLNDRRNWHLVSRHEIYKVKGLYIHREPQRYSIWTYDPVSHPLSN